MIVIPIDFIIGLALGGIGLLLLIIALIVDAMRKVINKRKKKNERTKV